MQERLSNRRGWMGCGWVGRESWVRDPPCIHSFVRAKTHKFTLKKIKYQAVHKNFEKQLLCQRKINLPLERKICAKQNWRQVSSERFTQ